MVDRELEEAIKFLAMEKRIQKLKEEKERLEAEFEKAKYGGKTKQETIDKLRDYFKKR